jgi:glycosyltransferase involved in cell wall biosynthesis
MKKVTIFILSVMTALLLPFGINKLGQRPYLSVVGFCKMADGLGRQCPDLIEALCDDFSIGFYPQSDSNLQDVPGRILDIIKTPNKKLGTVVFYNDSLWRPKKKGKSYGALNIFSSKKEKDQIRICYSMLESTRIPDEWVNIINNYFDVACVPDPFLEKVYKDSGVTTPVFTLPLGLNLKPFLNEPIKKTYHDVFRFACMGSVDDRKNQRKLILAFDKAFKDNPEVELVIHARRADEDYEKAIKGLIEDLNNNSISYQQDCLDNSDYREFFKTLDMLVNVSKGEGFSIQPREAMALGIPVLLSNNTAQCSIVKSAFVQSLETRIEKPCLYKNLNGIYGHNFDFEIDELVEALKAAYDNRLKFLEEAENNKAYAASFEYSKIKHLYKNIIKPEKIVLGDVNRILDDGIMTDSLELKQKYERLQGELL